MSYQDHQLKSMTAQAREGVPLAGLKVPPAKPKRKRSYEESDAQITFFKWLHSTHSRFGVPQCLVFAIPNGSALGTGKEDWQVVQRIIRGKRLIAEGLTPGVFDIFVSVPRPKLIRRIGMNDCDYWHGLYVEMKKADGKVSPEQVAFKAAAESWGYKTVICYSAQEAIGAVTLYLTI